MSLRLLAEFNLYQSQKEQYSAEEQEQILESFKKRLKIEMSKGGDGLMNFLDGINKL